MIGIGNMGEDVEVAEVDLLAISIAMLPCPVYAYRIFVCLYFPASYKSMLRTFRWESDLCASPNLARP